MQEAFMRRAIEIARASLDDPGALPYGAVVVKDSVIVGEGLNRAVANSDPGNSVKTRNTLNAKLRFLII